MICLLVKMHYIGQRYDLVAGSGFQTAMAQFLPKASGWQRSFHTNEGR